MDKKKVTDGRDYLGSLAPTFAGVFAVFHREKLCEHDGRIE